MVEGAFIALLCVIIAVPMFMTFSISLQTTSEIYASEPVIFPSRPQFQNYAVAMSRGNWPRYFLNSAIVTVLAVAISLAINSMAGFVFARIPFRGRNALFIMILLGMMIPAQVTMVPVFLLLKSVPLVGGNDIFGQGGNGLINTYAGLIAPIIAGSFGVFLCRQFYISFPGELDDAALIDGCGRFRQFVNIYLPLSGPLLASLGMLKFTGTWNEYAWANIITRGEHMKTVQIALTVFRDDADIQWNLLMAATIVVNIPVFLLFFFGQKYFVSGLLAGSVKG